jgi:diaminohydroxyphosphoribosylaminopyrimidine deaminase/5-amino-6-(5-phosphoribosylamino)uracil reductase
VYQDDQIMRRCLQLASSGLGATATNPLVGSVILSEGRIIGEGYHQQFGGPHAEVHAIASVENKNLLRSSILYVNLEPCSHHGKTPPCADLIIASGIPEVVVGMTDPNPLVAGSGIARLRDAGVKVRQDVLKDECRFLNRRFIVNQEKHRPYVILKWAQSADGYMDKERTSGEKGVYWITGADSRRLVHRWRSEESAVLVGAGTVRNDNPLLNVRELEGQQPVRVVLDPQCSLSSEFHVFHGTNKTLVINESRSEKISDSLFYIRAEEMRNRPESILRVLLEQHISSVMIEGGRYTLMKFIEAGLYDEIRRLTGNVMLHAGLRAPEIEISFNENYASGSDQVSVAYRYIS